jgi:hypothetical protein
MNSFLKNGSLRLFTLAGITVYLHWSWLAIAYFASIELAEHMSPSAGALRNTSPFLPSC